MRVKVKYAGLLTVLLVWSVFVVGCATTSGSGGSPLIEKEYGISGSGKAATIEKAYPDRFEKTKIGMDIRLVQ